MKNSVSQDIMRGAGAGSGPALDKGWLNFAHKSERSGLIMTITP